MVGCSSYDFTCGTSNIKHSTIGCFVWNFIDAIGYHLCFCVSAKYYYHVHYQNFHWNYWVINKMGIVFFVFLVVVPVWWHHSSTITSWHWDTHHVVIHTIVTCSMNFVWLLNHWPTIHDCLRLVKKPFSMPSQLSKNLHQPLHRPNINDQFKSHQIFVAM